MQFLTWRPLSTDFLPNYRIQFPALVLVKLEPLFTEISQIIFPVRHRNFYPPVYWNYTAFRIFIQKTLPPNAFQLFSARVCANSVVEIFALFRALLFLFQPSSDNNLQLAPLVWLLFSSHPAIEWVKSTRWWLSKAIVENLTPAKYNFRHSSCCCCFLFLQYVHCGHVYEWVKCMLIIMCGAKVCHIYFY